MADQGLDGVRVGDALAGPAEDLAAGEYRVSAGGPARGRARRRRAHSRLRPLDRAANLPRFPAVALAMPTSWTQEPDSSASRSKLARGQGASAVGAARGAALQRYAVAIRTVCRSGREERREWQKEGGGSSCGGDSDDGDIGRLVSTDLGEEVADELPQVPCVGTRRE